MKRNVKPQFNSMPTQKKKRRAVSLVTGLLTAFMITGMMNPTQIFAANVKSSSLSVLPKKTATTKGYTSDVNVAVPVLGEDSYIAPSSLASSSRAWGIAHGLCTSGYSDREFLNQYRVLANRLLYNNKYDGTGVENGAWLHTTYIYSDGKYVPYKTKEMSNGREFEAQAIYEPDLTNTYSTDFINVRYYRWDCNELDNAYGLYTDPDYPDSIKIDQNTGNSLIQNNNAARQFLGSEYYSGSVSDEVDKAYGYTGLRVKVIAYVVSQDLINKDIADPNISTSHHNNRGYTRGLFDGNSVKMSGVTYGSGSSALVGVCSDYNIVIVGSTSNKYSSSSSSNE